MQQFHQKPSVTAKKGFTFIPLVVTLWDDFYLNI